MEDETGFAGVIDNIRNNPMILGLLVVVLGIVVYFIHRSITNQGTIAAVPTTDTANPAVPIVYNNTYNSYPTVVPPPPGSPPSTPVVHIPTPTTPPIPIVTTPPPKQAAKYYTVTSWPNPGSSLSSIASLVHVSLSTIEALNPQIKNVNLIYPGQQVRYS